MGTQKIKSILYIFGLLGVIGIVIGISIAAGLSFISVDEEELNEGAAAALPTEVLDRSGRLITQFFSEEKRELVAIDELPRHLVYSLITREDRTFFEHNGFSVRGTIRAVWNQVTNRYFSGGSTLTQQLAGYLYADRSEITVSRKIRELWWAFQLEKHFSKYEILEKYLNAMYFGHGNYGVEAASQFFFGHSSRDLTIAESAMLVIQLANPSRYSPIRNPNSARRIQETLLNQMAELKYATQEEVDYSFDAYWNNYDYTRSNTASAFFERSDHAPYFSEYVRYLLENEYALGNYNINRDGFIVHTTLDLDYQKEAQEKMRAGLTRANQIYQRNSDSRTGQGAEFIPIINGLALAFNIAGMHIGDDRSLKNSIQRYQDNINPTLAMVSLLFESPADGALERVTKSFYSQNQEAAKKTTVEGALITLENDTGHILALVGGSQFEALNQFNRAIDARVEPGSSFKPLYYAAGIEHKVITPATLIYDAPVVFWNDDGTTYTPTNYKGEWKGPVLARDALAHSMNVPSLRVLERVGFSDALETARLLLDIPNSEMIDRNLVYRYPVGLGIVELAPVEMARAYTAFANHGAAHTPIAIRYIEDQNGKIIFQQESQRPQQILSPQTAYIMTDMLRTTVERGTLSYAASLVDDFDGMPMAGKTGTTQNWSDAWTVGFSPYYTTAIWFGFDKGGTNSLGTTQTGAVTTGPVWSRYMDAIHSALPRREFVYPQDGLVTAVVTKKSGLLPPEDYNQPLISEIFIEGTEPVEFDHFQQFEEEQNALLLNRLRTNLIRTSLDTTLPADESEDLYDGSLNLQLNSQLIEVE